MGQSQSAPSIRKIEASKKENINKSKKEMRAWGGCRYPVRCKPVDSVSQLNKKLNEFFEQYFTDDNRPSVNDLAIFLGYPSQRAIYREINNPCPNNIDYQALLERAVGIIDDRIVKSMMDISEVAQDYRGFDSALKRMDSINAKYETAATEGKASGLSININISSKMDAKLVDVMDSLKKAVTLPEAEKPVEASYTEIEDAEVSNG